MHGPTYIFWANLIPFSLQPQEFSPILSTAPAPLSGPPAAQSSLLEGAFRPGQQSSLLLQLKADITQVRSGRPAGRADPPYQRGCPLLE
jgi:hypothetical protein